MANKHAFDFSDVLNTAPEPQEQTPTGDATRSTTQYVSKRTGKTYCKRNFMFNNELWDKLQLLQRRAGMTQRELLETIIAHYIAEYEQKHGELKNEKIELI